MPSVLDWPYEGAMPPEDLDSVGAGNLRAPGFAVADAHGNPMTAGLKIFSDGNHHMALEVACRRFLELHPEAQDVFYTTAPAGIVRNAFASGTLRLGNLSISVTPNVLVGPLGNLLGPQYESGLTTEPRPFARSRGSVLLVAKGNPRGIYKASDLLRDDVTVAISSPTAEKASFGVYSETMRELARSEGGDDMADEMMARLLTRKGGDEEGRDAGARGRRTRHSGAVHHREIPQLVASGEADVAPVYYHLALRYVAIFPGEFDIVPLGGTSDDPRPGSEHRLNEYFVSVVKGNAGDWGEEFAGFMASSEVADIYRAKGLTPLP